MGLRFKSGRTRGGLIEKSYIENVRIMNIVREAILFDTYYGEDTEGKAQSDQRDVQPVNERTPRFREFTLSNITCNGAAHAMLINGFPEMPTEVYLQISCGPVFSLRHTHGMTLQRVDVLPADSPFKY